MYPIYLDYASTTPLDPRVLTKMQTCLTQSGIFANPSSLHIYGQQAKEAVEIAREQVARTINAQAAEIIWTSGATESNNLALKGAVRLFKRRGKHIVTMKTEHKAVLDTCQHLEKEGYSVTYLNPEANGLLHLDTFKSALREDTVLASIMHVNNETGVMQNMDAIAEITNARGILLHVDAAQSIGKTAIDLSRTPLDLLSLSAHKVYGPKGIGALYLRKKPRVRVEPLIHGGGHEQGMRSGTLATHQIVGMGEALDIARLQIEQDRQHVLRLRERFLTGLNDIKNMQLSCDPATHVPHILNIRFEGMFADALLAALPAVAASKASACIGKDNEGSYVLRAMGFSESQIKSAIRFSFGRFTTQLEIDRTVQLLRGLFAPS